MATGKVRIFHGRFGDIMNKKFWQNKRVLITGYEGFLGSNLTQSLLSYEAKIIGLDILTFRKGTLLKRQDIAKMKVIKGSVANFRLLQGIVKEHKIEYIFHLAAEAIVNKCLKNPMKTFSSNIRGTWNVLEVARLSPNIEGIMIASSDKAYGIKSKLPYKENASLSGSHPYDVSKSCADLLAYTYFRTYGVPVCVTRCGNIYGPGDFNFSRIIPDTIRAVLNNRTLLIRSDGKFTRDYIYVGDVVNAYLTLAEKLRKFNLSGEAFNFSNEKPISVLKLVEKIYSNAEEDPNYKILNKAKNEIPHQYLSSAKAKKLLNWKAKINLDKGLKKTIKWYKEL